MRRSSSITPDEHIASLPEGPREDMATLDGLLARAMSGHERVLWKGVFWGGTEQRIIGYGSYRQANRSGAEVDWFIVGGRWDRYGNGVLRVGQVQLERGPHNRDCPGKSAE